MLVHGGWTDHRTWAFVVPHLSDSYRVVRYDRRGHSRSPWALPVPRRQDEDDLAALIEELGAPVPLVGNSYGASISLGLTGRRAELVASVAVHEPARQDWSRQRGNDVCVQRHHGARARGMDLPGDEELGSLDLRVATTRRRRHAEEFLAVVHRRTAAHGRGWPTPR